MTVDSIHHVLILMFVSQRLSLDDIDTCLLRLTRGYGRHRMSINDLEFQQVGWWVVHIVGWQQLSPLPKPKHLTVYMHLFSATLDYILNMVCSFC